MIRLYTRDKRLEKLFNDAIAGEEIGVVRTYAPVWLARPRAADYMLTTRKLCKDIEWYAASLSAMPIVMPEGAKWLVEQLHNIRAQRDTYGTDVAIVGADYMRPPRNGE